MTTKQRLRLLLILGLSLATEYQSAFGWTSSHPQKAGGLHQSPPRTTQPQPRTTQPQPQPRTTQPQPPQPCGDGVTRREEGDHSRREAVRSLLAVGAMGVLGAVQGLSPLASSAATPILLPADQNYVREKDKINYRLNLPSNFKETSKPVKTHLDEVNFVSEDTKGYQYAITVDPVRINTLKEFGTPEQVAARVVTAEVNRDGIFEVTLLQDPYESTDGAYILEYLSTGKRGNKHYVNKIVISETQKLLYVLTAQVKQEDFPAQKEELTRIVTSFTMI